VSPTAYPKKQSLPWCQLIGWDSPVTEEALATAIYASGFEPADATLIARACALKDPDEQESSMATLFTDAEVSFAEAKASLHFLREHGYCDRTDDFVLLPRSTYFRKRLIAMFTPVVSYTSTRKFIPSLTGAEQESLLLSQRLIGGVSALMQVFMSCSFVVAVLRLTTDDTLADTSVLLVTFFLWGGFAAREADSRSEEAHAHKDSWMLKRFFLCQVTVDVVRKTAGAKENMNLSGVEVSTHAYNTHAAFQLCSTDARACVQVEPTTNNLSASPS